MKKFFLYLVQKPIFIVFMIVLVFYLPSGLSAPPESVDRQHVSTVGVDISDVGGVEVSLLSYVSSQSEKYYKKFLMVSAEAESVAEAIFRIGSMMGRRVSLSHVSVLVVGEDLAENGIEKYLDYFYRNENLTNDTYLVCARGKAKDLLQFEKERINSTGYGLEEMSVYGRREVYFRNSNVESFYRGYLGPVKSAIIPMIELEDNPDGEQLVESASSSSSGGSSSSDSSTTSSGGSESEASDGGTSSKKAKYMDELGLLKDGKLIGFLTGDEILATSLVNPQTRNIYFEIKNFSDENVDNADIVLQIKSNKIDKKAEFVNGKPVIHFNILIYFSISNIVNDSINADYFNNDTNYLTTEMKNRIENELKNKFSTLLQKIIEKKTDIITIYSTFFDQQYNEFTKWYEELDNKDDFLSQVEYHMTINSILTR